MRCPPRFSLVSLLAFASVACSASTDDPPASPGDGLPGCGDDPAAQPDRCVDAQGAVRCRVSTGYPGDELALCELDPEDGQVIHFGPSDYSDPDDVAKFVLEPGGEDEFCLYVNATNPEHRFFDSYHGRMRPNSHHLIVTMPTEHQETQTTPWKCSPQVLDRWLFGSQDPRIDVGVGAEAHLPEPGDPDYGLAHDIPPNQTLLIDFHNLNTGDAAELREAWASMHYTPADEVLVRADLLAFYNVGLNIPPNGHAVTSRLRCEAPKDAGGQPRDSYVHLLTGHAHQRMKRFSVWHEKADGASELVYETFDWLEPGNATYRDGLENPVLPVPAGQSWGARSGYLKVGPGEALSFECEYQNDLPEAVGMGETSKDEMCNVFGNYFPTVGSMWNCAGL